jgi:hypothetical protein
MKQRKWFWFVVPSVLTILGVLLGYGYLTRADQPEAKLLAGKGKENDPLPLRQVVLFNSGGSVGFAHVQASDGCPGRSRKKQNERSQ